MHIGGKEDIWDVVVIGGGPAGMMAAGRAAELGARVLLIEKNKTLGKKLLITGGGRCNVTNAEFDTRKLLAKYQESDKFLFSAFSERGVEDTLDFFHKRNMPTHVEAEKRVFPASNKAQSVWDVLVSYMKEGKVAILHDAPAEGLIKEEGGITSVKLSNGKEIRGRSFILASGGRSRPETGSTGDGFRFLKEIGHTVIGSNAALVPVGIRDAWVKKLSGVALPEVKITLLQDGKKEAMGKGKILFTHFGLSGPAVLNMSKDIGEYLSYGDVFLSIDLFPKTAIEDLDKKLQDMFRGDSSNKKWKNALGSLLPTAIAGAVVELSGIDPDTFCHSVTRTDRLHLARLIKHMPMQVSQLLGVDKAVITSGGVALPEIDFKTMRSKLYQNLYIVGDVLNINRPTGGYSLQLCWTTGYIAGTAAGKEA